MSVDLLAGDEMRSLSYGGFGMLLAIAQSHGWEPAGTSPPPSREEPGYTGEPWEGGYLTSDFQRIEAEDAAGIADALEKAASDLATIDRENVTPKTLRGWAGFFRLGSVVLG